MKNFIVINILTLIVIFIGYMGYKIIIQPLDDDCELLETIVKSEDFKHNVFPWLEKIQSNKSLPVKDINIKGGGYYSPFSIGNKNNWESFGTENEWRLLIIANNIWNKKFISSKKQLINDGEITSQGISALMLSFNARSGIVMKPPFNSTFGLGVDEKFIRKESENIGYFCMH